MKFRFAPSPTGLLHIGNIRTALVNWLSAHKNGGKFLLRIDDTDAERSKIEYEEGIKEDLKWLGLNWDETAKQSERFDLYEKAKQKLIEGGRLYRCYETEKELETKRKIQLSTGVPPIYDREGLKLTQDKIEQYEAKGRKPHWRFLLNDERISWNDEVRGETVFEARNLSDPILFREDGKPTYTLSSVVDDGDLKLTNIMRGEDHVTNTAIQIQLFNALGYEVPTFAHFALIKTKEGEMSKRVGGFDIRSLREEDIEPMAICSYLAKIGTSDPIKPYHNLDELIEEFDIRKFGRARANYDIEELKRLNKKLVGETPFEQVKGKIPDDIDEEFWLSVRPNIQTVSEVNQWWAICNSDFKPVITDEEYLKTAADALPQGDWDENTFNYWTDEIKERTGRKGKELFMPLRLALTGQENGPELKKIILLLGRDKVLERLG